MCFFIYLIIYLFFNQTNMLNFFSEKFAFSLYYLYDLDINVLNSGIFLFENVNLQQPLTKRPRDATAYNPHVFA